MKVYGELVTALQSGHSAFRGEYTIGAIDVDQAGGLSLILGPEEVNRMTAHQASEICRHHLRSVRCLEKDQATLVPERLRNLRSHSGELPICDDAGPGE